MPSRVKPVPSYYRQRQEDDTAVPAPPYGQLVDSTHAVLDYVFANIYKSQVPTGLLTAYRLHLVPLDASSSILTDGRCITPAGFCFIYGIIHTTRAYGTNLSSTIHKHNYNATVAL